MISNIPVAASIENSQPKQTVINLMIPMVITQLNPYPIANVIIATRIAIISYLIKLAFRFHLKANHVFLVYEILYRIFNRLEHTWADVALCEIDE